MHNTYLDSTDVKRSNNRTDLYTTIENNIVETKAAFEAERGYGGFHFSINDLSNWM